MLSGTLGKKQKWKGDLGEMKAYKGFNKDMTCRGFQFEAVKK